MLAYVGLSAAAHTGKHYGRNTGRPLVVARSNCSRIVVAIAALPQSLPSTAAVFAVSDHTECRAVYQL